MGNAVKPEINCDQFDSENELPLLLESDLRINSESSNASQVVTCETHDSLRVTLGLNWR